MGQLGLHPKYQNGFACWYAGPHLISLALITSLHNRGFRVLKDIVDASLSSPFLTHWKDAVAIRFPDPLIPEWKTYIINLKLSEIVLLLVEESLVRFGGSQLGKVIVKEAYQLISLPPRMNLPHP